MAKKILLLIIMGFSLALGGFWALKAQDPPQTVKDRSTDSLGPTNCANRPFRNLHRNIRL